MWLYGTEMTGLGLQHYHTDLGRLCVCPPVSWQRETFVFGKYFKKKFRVMCTGGGPPIIRTTSVNINKKIDGTFPQRSQISAIGERNPQYYICVILFPDRLIIKHRTGTRRLKRLFKLDLGENSSVHLGDIIGDTYTYTSGDRIR
jgi:hypothetical protein